MRREVPMLAELYPAGEKECGLCGTLNLTGESFHYNFKFFEGSRYLCPDCYKSEERSKRDREKQRIIKGEEPIFMDEIVCPYCGEEQMDSWEAPDSDDECECSYCEELFGYQREVAVTYSSYRLDDIE